jgi:alkylation response protein AidB-like acyl-CoA dehydrogenase
MYLTKVQEQVRDRTQALADEGVCLAAKASVGAEQPAALVLGAGQTRLKPMADEPGTRQPFGKVTADAPGVAGLLADIAKHIGAARLADRSPAPWVGWGMEPTKACFMADGLAANTAAQDAGNAVRVNGGPDCRLGDAVDRLDRDAKVARICDDTRRVRRRLIGRKLMKKGALR